MITVLITTKNEEENIKDLLDSLVIQDPPFEVIVVDAGSEDKTQQIINEYMENYDVIKLYIKRGTRPESMNYGIKRARGKAIAVLGGDCIADKNWLHELRKSISKYDIIMGKIINIGVLRYKDLERVKLYHKGYEVTYPGCNTTYKKEVLEKIGGFDPSFVTAEDIDLNYRAVSDGYKIARNNNAIIYHKTRETFRAFLSQAFWNGYGRKQLTLKHGKLWKSYRFIDMFKRNISFWYFCRLCMGLLGYLACKFFGRKKIEK